MTDQLPGVSVHVHEGRLNGIFEMPPADMPYISYQGRVMLVLLADAVKVTIGDTKDGDTKASWVFKAVDAAVVRDDTMRDHLASTLYLADEEDTPTRHFVDVPVVPDGPQHVGVYGEEGEFLGFESVDRDTGEIYEEDEEDEITVSADEEEEVTPEPVREPLFRPRQQAPQGPPPEYNPTSTETIETYGGPVTYPDKVLAGFIREGGS